MRQSALWLKTDGRLFCKKNMLPDSVRDSSGQTLRQYNIFHLSYSDFLLVYRRGICPEKKKQKKNAEKREPVLWPVATPNRLNELGAAGGGSLPFPSRRGEASWNGRFCCLLGEAGGIEKTHPAKTNSRTAGFFT